MAIRKAKRSTVPNGSSPLFQTQPPRKVLAAGEKAVARWREMVADAEAEIEVQRRDAVRRERLEGRRGLDRAEAVAVGRKEEVRRTNGGAMEIARDGLKWIRDKGMIAQPHYDAGLKFRGDYELANGTGVVSCLADPGAPSAFGPKSGPTDAMLAARGRVLAALKALGTPEVVPYVTLIAGQGVMLTDTAFVKDARRADEHKLPARIAFDLLARHYGMIR